MMLELSRLAVMVIAVLAIASCSGPHEVNGAPPQQSPELSEQELIEIARHHVLLDEAGNRIVQVYPNILADPEVAGDHSEGIIVRFIHQNDYPGDIPDGSLIRMVVSVNMHRTGRVGEIRISPIFVHERREHHTRE